MSLVDEINEYLKDDPSGVWDLAHNLDIAFVESEVHDEHRWSVEKHTIFQRKTIVSQNPVKFKDEFVLVVHHEPATELQEDIHESYPPTAFAVEPYLVEVVKYRLI